MATGAATPSAAPASNGASNGSANGTQAPGLNGANGTTPPQPGAQTASQKAEALRLERQLKYGDKVETIDMASDAALREIREARAERSKRDAYAREMAAWKEKQARLRADPLSALLEGFQEAGLNPDQVLEALAQQKQQLAQLTPEQQRIAELEAAIAKREAAEKAQVEKLQARAKQAAKQKRREAVRQTLLEAMREGGFPTDNPRLRGRALQQMAAIQMMEVRAGRPHMSPKELVSTLQRTQIEELGHLTSELTAHPEYRTAHAKQLGGLLEAATTGLEGPQLLQFLPKSLVKAVGNALLGRNQPGVVVSELPNSPGQSMTQPPNQQQPQSSSGQSLSVYEAQRRARELFRK